MKLIKKLKEKFHKQSLYNRLRFEFTTDQVFGTNMQKPMFSDYSGLTDTMWDLIIDTTGALIASISGYLYLIKRSNRIGLFEKYLDIYFNNQKNSSK